MISGLELLDENTNKDSKTSGINLLEGNESRDEITGLNLLENKTNPTKQSPDDKLVEPIRQKLKDEAVKDDINSSVFGRYLTQKMFPSMGKVPYASGYDRVEPLEYGIHNMPEQSIIDRLKGWWYNPDVSSNKAKNIVAISELTGLAPTEVLRNYDELSAKLFSGALVNPKKKFVEGAMNIGLGIGLLTNPLATASAVGTFFGLDELENLIVSKLKDKPYEFQEGLGIADLLEAEGLSRDALELLDFAWKVPAVGSTTKMGRGLLGEVVKRIKDKGSKIKFINKVSKEVKESGKAPDEVIVEKAKDLDVDLETIEKAHKKILEVEKDRIALEPDKFKNWIEEDLSIKNAKISKIKQAKKYILDEAIDKAMRKLPEGKNVSGLNKLKKPEQNVKDLYELDMKTGEREPIEFSTEKSPFREHDKSATSAMAKIYQEHERSIYEDPELFTGKLVNDVNRWLDGDRKIPIRKVRKGLSELAAKADELKDFFYESNEYPSNFINWKEMVVEAAKWARKAKRKGVEENGYSISDKDIENLSGIIDRIEGIGSPLQSLIYHFGNVVGPKIFDKINDILEKEGKYPMGNRAKEILESIDGSKIERSGAKLYSGIPVDKMKDEIIKLYKSAKKKGEEARGVKELKFKKSIKNAVEKYNRAFIDRSGNIRKSLIKDLKEDGYKTVQLLTLAKGANAKSAEVLRQMQREVYDGLSKKEKKILDDIIFHSRILDIAKYKTEKDFKELKKYPPEESAVYLELFSKMEGLSEERAKELYHVNEDGTIGGRAGAYFEWMRYALEDMLKSGLISEEEFNELAKHNYRRLKIADVIDEKVPSLSKKRKISVYDSGVESLARGQSTTIFDRDSRVMALEVFNRAYGRIFKNEANKNLIEVAKKYPENPFARLKEKKGDIIPSGWTKVYAFEDGKRKTVYISPEMSKEWLVNDPEMTYKLSNFIRWASGSALLRTFATGINWGFALANLPKDALHTWFVSRIFDKGKWKSVYSPHFPVFSLQITGDYLRVFRDALLRKGRYKDYINEGGGMEFLVHQGRLFKKGRHIESKLDKVQNVLAYPGETSELMTRLAIRERVIRRKAKELGISVEEARKNKDVAKEATFAARDYLDFSQGGWLVKSLDNAIPYLNASVQATRGLFRALKDDKLVGMYKLAQLAALVSGVYINGKTRAPKTMRELQGSIDMENNICIPLGDQFSFVDSRGNTRYVYLKIPIDSSQKFFKTFFEASTDKWLGNEFDVDRVVKALKWLSPVDTSSLPPTFSSLVGYVTNKNFWTNEDIWKRTEANEFPKSRDEFIPRRTPQLYIDIGKATGLSPERTKYAVEELVTNGTVWSYLLNEGYEKAFGEFPKGNKEQHLAEILHKMPMLKRFIGVTDPYVKYSKKLKDVKKDDELERFIQNRGLDLRAEGYIFDGNYSRKQVIDYIKGFKDLDTRKRLLDRFEFIKKTKNLKNRTLWVTLKSLSPEARAKFYVDALNNASEDERKELEKELGKVRVIGGVVSPRSLREVGRLQKGK